MNWWAVIWTLEIVGTVAACLWVAFNHYPSGSWWACHWCDWEAFAQRRFFDRDRATREFRQHLRDVHPDVIYDNRALWGRKGQR